MNYTKTVLASVCLGGALLLSGAASAEIKDRTLRFAFQNAEEHPQGQGAKKFGELVEQKSGGKIKVRLFPSGQLGGDLQTVSSLQGGTLDVTVLNAGPAGRPGEGVPAVRPAVPVRERQGGRRRGRRVLRPEALPRRCRPRTSSRSAIGSSASAT